MVDSLKIWIIVSEIAWNTLQETGRLITEAQYIETCYKDSYQWMIQQMEQRIGPPIHATQYPLWAWYQYENTDKRKPDLRHSLYLPSGRTGYRLTVEKDSNQVLFSDFELWHYVLNQNYLPQSMADSQDFSKTYLSDYLRQAFETYPLEVRNLIEKSWNRIFDLDFQSIDIAQPFEQKQIQATFWDLKLQDVTKVDKFVAR